MIFTELVLHNFGIYRGRHIVDLRPQSTEKPILLFGGLNGGGKTTFLDAMKLALYGKLADCSNRKNMPYDTFLESAINRYSPPDEGAALELEFIASRGGSKTRFRVKRFWRKTSKSVTESIEVLEDGALSPVLSSHWAQHVDEFIPQDIAGLFFFDGEKIESLADKRTSASIIRTGIYSLLGLNIIDKLDTDLRQLNKRRAGDAKDTPVVGQLDLLEESIKHLEKEREKWTAKLAELNTFQDQLHGKLKIVARELKAAGGDFYLNREANIEKLAHINEQLGLSKAAMLETASGISPLCLVENLLNEAKDQSVSEHQAAMASAFNCQLVERDAAILKLIAVQAGPDITSKLEAWMTQDKQSREEAASVETYLHCEPSIFDDVRPTDLQAVRETSAHHLAEHDHLEHEKSVLEELIAKTPDDAAIGPLLANVEKAEAEITSSEAQAAIVQQELNTVEKKLAELGERQIKLDLQLLDSRFDNRKITLINERSNKVAKTLKLYRAKMLERHLHQLEELILDSFTSLARKERLLSKVSIDPDSFEITVYDSDEHPLPTDRLSAGERQLFAVSILWGLAKASGRPLPAIVDTPLGRLDSKHRTHLVENYFPRASHQVILLSTDEEIDQRYRKKLEKYIGKEYHIQYSSDDRTSCITPGYF